MTADFANENGALQQLRSFAAMCVLLTGVAATIAAPFVIIGSVFAQGLR